jgi:hypothetical protein
MERPALSRRAFVASVVPALAALGALRPVHAGEVCERHAVHRGPPGPHPTPRPGIDGSRVLTADQLADVPRAVLDAFDAARRIPQVVDGIRCHCGCAERDGNYSLLSCFEGGGMARHCDVCQGQARLALRLHRAGKSLRDIRAAIDARYG